jgi:alkylated DNA repair dioxygenase AlkB
VFRQATLFGDDEPAADRGFSTMRRLALDERSWVDHAPRWLSGSDVVFDRLADVIAWRQRQVVMWGRPLDEPRLSGWWTPVDGPEPVPALAEMRRVLSARYGVAFSSVGFNWYRDGNDSVAWHADRKGPRVVDPTIAIVSVGDPRPFRLRPMPGGPAVGAPTRVFDLGHGDLLVMGGSCQHEWEHVVPKSRGAGPRISITFRHDGVY